MLLDRSRANSYAQPRTSDPRPGTPVKHVLRRAGYSDPQVTNLAAEVESRTIGTTRIASDLPVCRHWARDPMFGFAPHDPGVAEPAVLAYFDSGTPRAPTVNRPSARGDDPHGDPRHDPDAIAHNFAFYESGRVPAVGGGQIGMESCRGRVCRYVKV